MVERHLGPNEPILRPRGSNQLDWEVELGVVIGKTARFVSKDKALDYVWGYTIINDVSSRDFQFIGSQWMAGKIPETFAPVGPYIADRAEIPDPHVLELKLWVNGKQMQAGNTKTVDLRRPRLVSYITGLMSSRRVISFRRARRRASAAPAPAGVPAAGRYVPARDHRTRSDREPREGGVRRSGRCSM